MKVKDIFVCNNCGSKNVLKLAWIDPNKNNRFVKHYDENENSFCYDCYCLITKLKEVKPNKRKTK